MKNVLKYILIVVVSIIIGGIITYIVLNKKSDITHIYDSLVHIEAYNDEVTSNASGFAYKVYNNKVYIITNYHVIDGYKNIYVYNMDNEKEKAEVLEYDVYKDIAVLVISNTLKLKEATITDSDKLNIGDEIFVVGSPIANNYPGSITHGIISYLDRKITLNTSSGQSTIGTIQVDAAINPGSSGGPLINKNGNVIGLISTKEGNANGVGFAIPINYVMKQIKNNK